MKVGSLLGRGQDGERSGLVDQLDAELRFETEINDSQEAARKIFAHWAASSDNNFYIIDPTILVEPTESVLKNCV
jgi:thymidylate kinase